MQNEKIAAYTSDGFEAMTHARMERESSQLAAAFLKHGLKVGDRVAILMENNLGWLSTALAIRRAGMLIVPLNWHLRIEEVQYVLANSDARALITSEAMVENAAQALRGLPEMELGLIWGEAQSGFVSISDALASIGDPPPVDEWDGGLMAYSSGTTGKPKGIIKARAPHRFGTPNALESLLVRTADIRPDTVYLCPAPLYHSAPINWSMTVLLSGGTVVLMPTFDAEAALAAIERFKVSIVQFVPTHMIRIEKLPAEVRERYDLSSLRCVVHAAAPCPPDVKRRMIEWLGPIILEYYAGSEGCGFTSITADEWLSHPGSVGRSKTGAIHIVDPETGDELPTGEVGLVYFEGGEGFRYHKDPERTRQNYHAKGWGTHGDLGRVDEDGYLYLSDRLTHLILSGGVNIYPQEVENILIDHPAIADVAVVGVPNEDMGQEVKAVVQLTEAGRQHPPAADEIIAYCREHLAGYKCPRSVDFTLALPRHPNGKLLKRELMDRYR